MDRICALSLLLACSCLGAADSTLILERARHAVADQLDRVANYTCVETIERKYYVEQPRQLRGCGMGLGAGKQVLWMDDRLRLDIAVSAGHEIYSWHGEDKFTASSIADVVEGGPISSGNFIGFLQNIFLGAGIHFHYIGEGEQTGSKLYTFNYDVPLAYSAYHITAKAKPALTVPFHGSFVIDGSTYQLRKLQVIPDAIPPASRICSAETSITYQIVDIGGRSSLIPASFVLQTVDERRVRTDSSSEYSACREFRGESTLHFESVDAPVVASNGQSKFSKLLPAGIPLRVALSTAVDDGTAYVGDQVQGTLLQSTKVAGTDTVLPKGAVLAGVVTKLEHHYIPAPFQVVGITFQRLSSQDLSYTLIARPETSVASWKLLNKMYGSPLPDPIAQEANRGILVIHSSHVLTKQHFSAKWITAIPSSVDADLSLQ